MRRVTSATVALSVVMVRLLAMTAPGLEPQQPEQPAAVGRIEQRDAVAPGLSEDGALVAEAQEARLAVVGAHAALAHAAEGQGGHGVVPEGVVEDHAAGVGGLKHPAAPPEIGRAHV